MCEPEACLDPATTTPDDMVLAAECRDLGEMLWTQVQRIVAALGMSQDEVADRFFDGIHTWLPIISPHGLRRTIHSLRDATAPPDFSALLLALCLVTFRPAAKALDTFSTNLTSLYVTTKSVFAEAQTVVCASTAIIQAGTLLATYEYASGRIEAAYISVGLTSRMCQVLGIDHISESSISKGDLGTLEDLNVWWSIIILERYAPSSLLTALKANI